MPETASQNINSTDCLICQGKTEYYFSKNYSTYPSSPFSETITVAYWKCKNCGFVYSKTHQELPLEQWEALNSSWHIINMNLGKDIAAPPYADQALTLVMLHENGLIDLTDSLDYAAGQGKLSSFLQKYFHRPLPIFDRYVQNKDSNIAYISPENLSTYKLVVNSAMLEHVVNRQGLDAVNDLVAEDGVLMIHSVICQRIPQDPKWFYLAPIVHSAFHTNKSMGLLMEQWGYAASIYSPQAKSWFLFKKSCKQLPKLAETVRKINSEIDRVFFIHKNGFVDYWKGF